MSGGCRIRSKNFLFLGKKIVVRKGEYVSCGGGRCKRRKMGEYVSWWRKNCSARSGSGGRSTVSVMGAQRRRLVYAEKTPTRAG